jgi:hypothetical protein
VSVQARKSTTQAWACGNLPYEGASSNIDHVQRPGALIGEQKERTLRVDSRFTEREQHRSAESATRDSGKVNERFVKSRRGCEFARNVDLEQRDDENR